MKTIMKKSLICKNVQDYTLDATQNMSYLPKVGDVGLFRIKEIGKHTRVQNYKGKNRLLFQDDLVLCAFGNRYASNQIEGYIPDRSYPEYHMLGQGGVVGIVKSMYKPLEEKGPTTMELVSYATDALGRIINVKTSRFELAQLARQNHNTAKIILSIGTSMDSGKTTTAGYLCRGLAKAGRKVSFMKLTGTVYTKDLNLAMDCGAHSAIDFGHHGYPSTYMCNTNELIQLFHALLHALEVDKPDYVVVEIADGLLQRETAALLQTKSFMRNVHGSIFSAGDSLGVLSGLHLLKKWNITPFAVAGLFTSRPLLVEEVKNVLSTPILTLDELQAPYVQAHVENSDHSVQRNLNHVEQDQAIKAAL
jgi:hypothetical protein